MHNLSKQRPGTSPNPRSPVERRVQILEAAESCFKQRGFYASSTAEISKKAAISRAGIYCHFPSKQALVESLIERELAMALTMLEHIQQANDFFAELESSYKKLLADGEPGFNASLRLEIFAMYTRSPHIGAMIEKAHTTFIHGLTAVIEHKQRDGQIASELTPSLAAKFMITVTHGLLTCAPLSKAIQESYLQSAIGLLKTALQPKPTSID